jgi:hypothetical protein
MRNDTVIKRINCAEHIFIGVEIMTKLLLYLFRKNCIKFNHVIDHWGTYMIVSSITKRYLLFTDI